MKETTYNKYKRENRELKQIVAADVRFFCIGQQDFSNRLSFIKKMMLQYRAEQIKEMKDAKIFTNTKDAVEYMKKNKNTTIIIDEAGTNRLGKSDASLKMIRLLKSKGVLI